MTQAAHTAAVEVSIDGTTYYEIDGIKEFTATEEKTSYDTTNFKTAGIGRTRIYGLFDSTISMSGDYEDSDTNAQNVIRAALIQQFPLWFRISYASGIGSFGQALVEDCTISAEKEGIVGFEFSAYSISSFTTFTEDPDEPDDPIVFDLVAGIWSLSTQQPNNGFVEVDDADMVGGLCPITASPPNQSSNGVNLCRLGFLGSAMDSTWEDPDIVGVYVRLDWRTIEVDPDVFDYTVLDHELSKAVANNKKIMICISAGNGGTPQWLPDVGVTLYHFKDGGSDIIEGTQCGVSMDLGNPCDPAYQERYFGMLTAVSDHIKTDTDWVRTLAAWKVSGANLLTDEARLPYRCQATCLICNSQVWADAGYRPSLFYDFWEAQMATIQSNFPGLPMVFQLIQGGLPHISETGGYLNSSGVSSDGSTLVTSLQQVNHIIDLGRNNWDALWVVMHNGLRQDLEPNHQVLAAGLDGSPTAFQTVNNQQINTPADLQLALENARDNSDCLWVECYEDVLWQIRQEPGRLLIPDPDPQNTIAEWTAFFQARKESLFPAPP